MFLEMHNGPQSVTGALKMCRLALCDKSESVKSTMKSWIETEKLYCETLLPADADILGCKCPGGSDVAIRKLTAWESEHSNAYKPWQIGHGP